MQQQKSKKADENTMEIGDITGFDNPDTGTLNEAEQVTPSASVFGQDLTETHSKSKPKGTEDDEEEQPTVFQKYERNETFPIHATLDDS